MPPKTLRELRDESLARDATVVVRVDASPAEPDARAFATRVARTLRHDGGAIRFGAGGAPETVAAALADASPGSVVVIEVPDGTLHGPDVEPDAGSEPESDSTDGRRERLAASLETAEARPCHVVLLGRGAPPGTGSATTVEAFRGDITGRWRLDWLSDRRSLAGGGTAARERLSALE